jgi:hypothetical protein
VRPYVNGLLHPFSVVRDDSGQRDREMVPGRQVCPGSRPPLFFFFLIHLAGLSVVRLCYNFVYVPG